MGILAMCLALAALLKRCQRRRIRCSVGFRERPICRPEASLRGRGNVGIADIRPNGLLFFASANWVGNDLRAAIKNAAEPVREVMVNLAASPEIDVTRSACWSR
jgi:MFS superfamily sulfate permease-like transporter